MNKTYLYVAILCALLVTSYYVGYNMAERSAIRTELTTLKRSVEANNKAQADIKTLAEDLKMDTSGMTELVNAVLLKMPSTGTVIIREGKCVLTPEYIKYRADVYDKATK